MGNRRITRTESDATITVLTERYEGERFNSPNDLVYKSDGSLYFTDPPFGLRKMFDDPNRELDFSGVFRWKDNKTTLITKELNGPNGIAFSPDEKYLYVGNWDTKKVWLMRYPLNTDGTVAQGKLIFDLTGAPPTDTAFDGMKVDKLGNIYITGPGGINGGVWVLSGEGKRLGYFELPKQAHNLNWGGSEGKDLYITAMNAVYRMPLLVEGVQAGVHTLDSGTKPK
jgi:gluconolactonase